MYTMVNFDIMPPLLIITMVAGYRHLKNERKRRACWTRPWIHWRQEHKDASFSFKRTISRKPRGLKKIWELPRKILTELLEKVSPFIVKKDIILRKSISLSEKLYFILRYLATCKKKNTFKYHIF